MEQSCYAWLYNSASALPVSRLYCVVTVYELLSPSHHDQAFPPLWVSLHRCLPHGRMRAHYAYRRALQMAKLGVVQFGSSYIVLWHDV